jgi:hypothetical protein
MPLCTISVLFYATKRVKKNGNITLSMMKKRQKILILSSFALVGAIVFSLVGLQKNSDVLTKGSGKTYTVTLNSANLLTSSDTVKINDSYSLSLFKGGWSTTSGEFGTLASGGYLGSNSPLYGMTSFAIKLTSGSINAFFGHSAWGREQAFGTGYFTVGTLSSVVPGAAASYFYLAPGSSGAVINEIQITYQCIATSYTAESDDLLDGVNMPESPNNPMTAMTLSDTLTDGDARSLHLSNSVYGTANGTWPSVLLTLKSPLSVGEGGRFTLNSYLETGKNFLSIALYDSSWALYQFSGNTKGEYSTTLDSKNTKDCWNSIQTSLTIQPSCPGTYNASTNPYQSHFSVSFIRLFLDTYDASEATSLYLDSLVYDHSGEVTSASLWSAYNTENLCKTLIIPLRRMVL